VIYQHPLAYLLGLEGVALLRAFAGDFDRDFGDARIAEICMLLDSPTLAVDGVVANRVDTVEGYRIWSTSYDEPGNGLFPYEEPIVREIIDGLPAGLALDAACGTGRYIEYLATRGNQVIGVDSSPDMLEYAAKRVPQVDLRRGDLLRLPLPDRHVDLVVCALALTHVPDLAPVLGEFARVLRPGGHLVISDVHHVTIALGSVPHFTSTDGRPVVMPAYRHLASDYLGAALPLGFELRRCEEPRLQAPHDGVPPAADEITLGPWEQWPFSLHSVISEATRAAYEGTPVTIVWHFQLPLN
jgi:SAM-dependent methyltransferase